MTKYMGKENCSTAMEIYMKVTINAVLKKDKEYIFFQLTKPNMKVSGYVINLMATEFSITSMEICNTFSLYEFDYIFFN